MFGFKKAATAPVRHYAPGTLSVSDAGVRERIAFLGLDTRDLGVIAAWKSACEASSDTMVDEFYKHIFGTPTTKGIIAKHSSVERQRPMLTRYVLTMFSGVIDDTYVMYRDKVGVVHDNIDLDSNWYVAMYEIIRNQMVAAVKASGATPEEEKQFSESFSRLIQLDIALVVTALTNSRRDKIERQANELKHFLGDISGVLDGLAARDLTVRLHGTYKGEYAKTSDVLNSAIGNLESTLSEVLTASEQVTQAAGQINAASDDLARNSSSQAASLEETSASLQEVTAMAASSAANAREGQSLADRAGEVVAVGANSMIKLDGAMEQMRSSADRTARIVKTIDEIAFQTNLLALNAAVEAARAGDAGRGFAVVAEEVRNLALRSAEAAKTTSSLLEESVKSVMGGVQLSQEVGQSLSTISEQVLRVRQVMAEIASASDQQREGVSQINIALETMNGVTQGTAAASEESAATAAELAAQAQSLEGLVSTFKIGGVSAPAAPAPRGNSGWSPKPTNRIAAYVNGNGKGHKAGAF